MMKIQNLGWELNTRWTLRSLMQARRDKEALADGFFSPQRGDGRRHRSKGGRVGLGPNEGPTCEIESLFKEKLGSSRERYSVFRFLGMYSLAYFLNLHRTALENRMTQFPKNQRQQQKL